LAGACSGRSFFRLFGYAGEGISMGAAAYNRASRVVRERIKQAYDEGRPMISPDENINRVLLQAERIRQLENEVARLENDLSRARRLIRSLQASKTALWEQKSKLSEIAKQTKHEFLSHSRYAHCYGVIVLAQRLGLF
jgi:HAMP domain-containing protein